MGAHFSFARYYSINLVSLSSEILIAMRVKSARRHKVRLDELIKLTKRADFVCFLKKNKKNWYIITE